MGILQVVLFGGVRVTHDNWATEVIMTREIQLLLAYLLLQRQKVHSRDTLSGVFWGEQSQAKARGSLNTAIWKLKKFLEPDGIPTGTYLKNTRSGEIGFNWQSDYWLDVEIFEQEIARVASQPVESIKATCLKDLGEVIKLYKGELLEGLYKDWALRELDDLWLALKWGSAD